MKYEVSVPLVKFLGGVIWRKVTVEATDPKDAVCRAIPEAITMARAEGKRIHTFPPPHPEALEIMVVDERKRKYPIPSIIGYAWAAGSKYDMVAWSRPL